MSSHLRRLANAKKIRRTPPKPDSEQENQVETSALDVQNIVQMQSIVGNRAVQRLIDKGYFAQPSARSNTGPQRAAQPSATLQSKMPIHQSAALHIRRQLRQMPLRRAIIQRAAVGTWAGDWDTDKYDIIKDGTGKEVGVDIELKFTPNKKTNATKIGTLQMVNSLDKGKVIAINPTVKDRSIPAGTAGEGFHVDQAPHNRNPLYAVEGAPAKDAKLTDTAPNATWGQHGYRYKDGTGTEHQKDATLKDTPTLPGRGANASQKFETTALAISGEQEGTYYGSVQWGWESDGTGKFTQLPLTLISNDVPSSTLAAASGIWNASKTSSGEDSLDLPIVEGKYTNTPGVHLVSNPSNYQATHLRNLALNTRLEVTNKGDKKPFNNVADNLKWWKVTIVDGTAAGLVGWVMQANLGDNKVKPAGTP